MTEFNAQVNKYQSLWSHRCIFRLYTYLYIYIYIYTIQLVYEWTKWRRDWWQQYYNTMMKDPEFDIVSVIAQTLSDKSSVYMESHNTMATIAWLCCCGSCRYHNDAPALCSMYHWWPTVPPLGSPCWHTYWRLVACTVLSWTCRRSLAGRDSMYTWCSSVPAVYQLKDHLVNIHQHNP